MKRIIISICFFYASVITLLTSNSCKKNSPSIGLDSANITLYNKPLNIIQAYLQGKWKLIYGKGGISSNTIQYYQNIFWEFDKNTIEILDSGNAVADTTIQWIYNEGTYTNGSYTYIMNFSDQKGYIYDYVVDSIINDTLILHEDASDAVFYHFVKSH